MKDYDSRLVQAIRWLRRVDGRLTPDWPPELPPESDPDFWRQAARLEMLHRTSTTQKIELLIASGVIPASMTVLELWFLRRRMEWAGEFLLATAQKSLEPDMLLRDLLRLILIDSWNNDGCISFWTQAVERGGAPHPENLDGETPLGC